VGCDKRKISTCSSTIIGSRGLIQSDFSQVWLNGRLDITLPIRINGRSLVKKVICDAFAVAHDEMKTKDLQMDDVRIYRQWLVSVEER